MMLKTVNFINSPHSIRHIIYKKNYSIDGNKSGYILHSTTETVCPPTLTAAPDIISSSYNCQILVPEQITSSS